MSRWRRFLRWTMEYDPYYIETDEHRCVCGQTFATEASLEDHPADEGDDSRRDAEGG